MSEVPGQSRPLPRHPSGAAPGSAEKVAVMRRRFRLGEQLFHPLDRRARAYGSPPDTGDLPLGVSWVAARGKYRVCITAVTGERLGLGMFVTVAECVRAIAAAIEAGS